MRKEGRASVFEGSATTHQLETEGFVLVRALFDTVEIERLKRACEDISEPRAGVRDLLQQSPAVRELARSERVLSVLSEMMDRTPFAVRGILFDKTPGANWFVSWHQDLTITVRARREVSGFSGWSLKDGIQHVQAPDEVLARMVTLRLHLDDCDSRNGALRVVRGSHRHGRLSNADISMWKENERTCEARAGDALFMRPLLLHASSPAQTPRHRRVIHIEFAGEALPDGLEWFERVER